MYITLKRERGTTYNREARTNFGRIGKQDGMELGGARYTSAFAIQCLMCSSYLCNAADLPDVVALSVRLSFPKDTAEHLLQLVQDLPLPSPATLSRWRLRLDCAFMLVQRRRYQSLLEQGSLYIYALCDASPQAGREWFMTEVHTLSAATMEGDLSQVFFVALAFLREATRCIADPVGWVGLPPPAREGVRQSLAERRLSLARCVEVIVAPPVGLGHRRTSRAHKVQHMRINH